LIPSDFRESFVDACPLIAVQGFVSTQTGESRAGQVAVYGVDDRFWRFHIIEEVSGPQGREAMVSPALARELDATEGTTLLVRLQKPSEVPLESLHGRKDDLGHTVRATLKEILPREAMGEFTLQPQQGEVRAIFLPLGLLQQELEIGRHVNTLLVSARPGTSGGNAEALTRMVEHEMKLEDGGLQLRFLEGTRGMSLEAEGGLLNEAQVNAAAVTTRVLGIPSQPVFAYLVDSLRSGDQEIPYSLVTGMDIPALATEQASSDPPPVVLNDWAARDLRVSPGDTISMDYFVWEEPGRLAPRTTEFRVAGLVPVDPHDRDLAPVYRGVTESETLRDWNPPFPIDLRRIRGMDEEYWELYRTTPKAFIPFAVAQRLWKSRHGSMTSIRFAPQPRDETKPVDPHGARIEEELRFRISTLASNLSVRNVRAEGLEASVGATDFGAYFVYFSFFLVVSALLLAALFFRLSIEQRAREVGLLRAVGFKPASVQWIYLREGLWLSVAGAAMGVLGGIGYAWLMMTGLRTWWVEAVGTTALTFHLSTVSITAGALGGIVASMACIWLTLRRLSGVSERRLLAEQLAPEDSAALGSMRKSRRGLIAGLALAVLGAGFVVAAMAGLLDRGGAFFLAGMALLSSTLFSLAARFSQSGRTGLSGHGWLPVAKLGWRSSMYRPARSVTAMAMIASATFILIAVDTFRKANIVTSSDRKSGTGGYVLMLESLLPVAHDPGSRQGRETLGLNDFDSVAVEPFRLRPGDDASCLNLYEPKNPRILAPRDRFIEEGRFSFRSSLASDAAERANPWRLLYRDDGEDVVPVIADANSMTYILHRKLGEDIEMTVGERIIRFRLVAALSDSIFQGELLMSQDNFLRLFPDQEGYRFLLVEAPHDQQSEVAAAMEEALVDFGADVRSAAQHLAEFHRVENTYLSTFQMLGGLGLLLGTFGLGAVLLRNILERRRELALLRALGYRRAHFFAMMLSENGLVLLGGLLTGVVCAMIAIAPSLLEQSGRLPARALLLLLSGVLAAGLLTSVIATMAALRSPLLRALRSE
jgi:ABC-type lipoprotein release transport system permease subunit